MSAPVIVPEGRVVRPRDPRRRKLQLAFGLIGLFFVFALWQTGFTPWAVIGRSDAVLRLMERMWAPDFSEWRRYLAAVIETLWMVIAGTAIAIALAIPVSVLAARNTTSGPVAYNVCRLLITLTRAVPSLVFALVFVRAIGVGPVAGVLAMGISSIGMVGKFFSDRIEEIDMGIVEASRASGASRTQTFVSAVVPQILTNWISLSLYRLDINLRSAVILGYVGAGGIGLELQRVQGQLAYPRVLAIAVIIFVLVLLTEQASAIARRSVMGREGTDSNPFGLRARMRAARAQAREARAEEARLRRSRADGSRTETATGTTEPDGAEPDHRTPPHTRITEPWTANRVGQWVGIGVTALAIIGSFVLLRFGPVQLVQALGDIIPYIAAMFPPDLSTNLVPHLDLMLETICMALVATVLGMIISLPIGILGASNATAHPIAAKTARFLTVAVRGMPELIIAVLLVVAFGLGPVAGMLALTIGSIGLAGKLIADAIEDTDLTGPTEAMRSVGAGWMQRTVTSTVPQCAPAIIGTGLYMFDVFVRAATTLGIVGAGGIGLALDASIRARHMDQTLAIILMIFIAVYGIERLSAWFRKQIL